MNIGSLDALIRLRVALRNSIGRWPLYLRGALMARLPAAAIEPLALTGSRIRGLADARARCHGEMRCEIGRDVLGSVPFDRRRVAASSARERLIDLRMYYGRLSRGVEVWPDLHAIAARLANEIRRLKAIDPKRPVIVSPFHYVSQYANIYVVDALRVALGLESIAVVSAVPRDMYGDDSALIPGVDVLYTYGDGDRNGLGLRVARALRRTGVAVLFADVPPFALHRYPMETVGVSMFGRPARIHNGVFRLGTQFDATLLPFYLRFDGGRFSAELFEPLALAGQGAPQQLGRYIETALINNFPHSLVTVNPSMYAFAPTR